ncbi:MAG TPA: MAB_1171c family putative transporter [Candidatus Limnocylindrales bacterium]|nr:MAB_1171c family putative transporter [Candidatus Limnocylindrales bacterium]
MGELLPHYGPPVLAWVLLLSRLGRIDRARQWLRWMLFGLAVSLTALTPMVYTAIGQVSGTPHLARLLAHGSMLFAVWAGQKLVTHVNGLGNGLRWQGWWIAGAFTVMCLLFVLAPQQLPQSPGVLEYCVAYLAGQAPILGNVIRLGLRYARLTDSRAVGIGMLMVVAGTVAALLYLINKVVLTAASRLEFAYPLGRTTLVSQVLPASAHVLVLLGVALPAILGWLYRYRLYQRLGPLWHALYRVEPAIALDPPRVPDLLRVSQLRLHVYRRVIEIRDGLLALQPYRDPFIAATTTERATRAGMRGQELAATIEAATIAAALQSRTAKTPPTALSPSIAGGGDLHSDTAFLSQVAYAYRKHHRRKGCRSDTRLWASLIASPRRARSRRLSPSLPSPSPPNRSGSAEAITRACITKSCEPGR